MFKRLLVLLVAISSLALAGCGGSSGGNAGTSGTGTGTTSPAAAKSAFDNQLSSLCIRANNAFSAAHNTQGQVAVITHYVALFRALKPPPQLAALYSNYLTVLEKELAALKKGDSNTLFHLAHSEAKPLVKKIGAKGCITAS